MKKLTFAIAGLGSRGYDAYGRFLRTLSDEAQVVAAAEPRPERMEMFRRDFDLPDEMCFETAEDMLRKEKLADVMIIATLDRMHCSQALAALEKGYDLLLEKPISVSPEECKRISDAARKYGRKVVVCHVLRYTPFYRALKKLIDGGQIGRPMSIQAMERVCYWHQAHSFVRGNWHNSDKTSSMILQKCCHDMDIYTWLVDKKCRTVSSFGELSYFRADNAPLGATEHCSDVCTKFDTCVYNPYRYYGDILKKGFYWPVNVVISEPSEKRLDEALKTGPYGKCVFLNDNNVVDHQIVNLLLEDDVTVSFTMCAFTATPGRTMMIMGTEGHIEASMDDNYIRLCRFGEPEVTVDAGALEEDRLGHGGGDGRMMRALIGYLRDGVCDRSVTTLERSTESHFIAMAAEYSRKNGGKAVDMKGFIDSVKI